VLPLLGSQLLKGYSVVIALYEVHICAQGLTAGCLYCTPSLHLTLQQRVVGSIRSCVTLYGRLDSSLCSQLIKVGRGVVTALHEVPMLKDLLVVAYIALPYYISRYSSGLSVPYAYVPLYGWLDSSSCLQLSWGRSVVIALYEVPCAQGLTGGGLYRTPLLHLTL
jgi:hypothetical protein